MTLNERILLGLTWIALCSGAVSAQSVIAPETESPQTTERKIRFDVEIDPTAYLLKGYSLHGGVGQDHWRLDAGVYSAEVPRWLHGNDGFKSSVTGVGIKIQYFTSGEQRGLFFSPGFSVSRNIITLEGTTLESRQTRYAPGVDVGYRFTLSSRFYVTPWAGLDYSVNARDTTLAGKSYKDRPLGPFAAVHVGYRFSAH